MEINDSGAVVKISRHAYKEKEVIISCPQERKMPPMPFKGRYSRNEKMFDLHSVQKDKAEKNAARFCMKDICLRLEGLAWLAAVVIGLDEANLSGFFAKVRSMLAKF